MDPILIPSIPSEAPSLVWSVAKAFMALGFLAILAYVIYRYASPVTGFRKKRGDSTLAIEERFPLEPRRSLYIIKAGSKRLLLGASEGGLGLIADLTDDRHDAKKNT